MKHQQSITSLPPSPDADRHSRMLKYGIMMGIRVICLIVVFFLPGWWKVIPALGAVFLPYFAVVVANVGSDRSQEQVPGPGGILPYGDYKATVPPAGDPEADLNDDVRTEPDAESSDGSRSQKPDQGPTAGDETASGARSEDRGARA